MPHGRGQVQYVELGLHRDGTIVGLRCRIVGDAGAYAGFGGMLAFGPTRIDGAGRVPHPEDRLRRARSRSRTPRRWARYRGAGRPEAAAMLERIIDMAADELDIDPVELRRRNFLQPDEFPYSTVTRRRPTTSATTTPRSPRRLRVAGYDELRAEQAERRRAAAT